jgi:RNA polymerase sigma-70 factor, ECF subfamily
LDRLVSAEQPSVTCESLLKWKAGILGNLALVDEPKMRLSEEQITALVDRYQNDLFHFLLGILRNDSSANDALQNTLMKLVEQGGGVAAGSLKSWVYRVAFNEAMEIRRRYSLEARHYEPVAIWRSAHKSLDSNDKLMAVDRATKVREALEKLPREQQQVVHLRIYDDLKFAEIAEILKVPLGTVLTRMRAGLGKLKAMLENENEL